MNVLLNDASVLLNLLATGCLEDIVTATGLRIAICPAVRDEVKRLRDPESGEMVVVDLSPLMTSGLLQLVDLSGEEEQALYVQQAALMDDGEAMSVAIAASRRLELALDDKRAAKKAREQFPALRLWTTPEILKLWADNSAAPASQIINAIRLIEVRARYFPPKGHPLAAWWQALRKGDC